MSDKKCPQCGQIRHVGMFGYRVRTRKNGNKFINIQPWCIDCRRAKARDAAKAQRSTPEGLEKHRLAVAQHRQRIGAEGRAQRRANERVVFEGVEMTVAEKRKIVADRNNKRKSERNAAQKAKAEMAALAKAEKIKLYPWTDPTLSPAERFKLQYKLDTEFHIKQRLRNAMRRKRPDGAMGNLMRAALNRNGKSVKFEQFAGYSISRLRTHIEAQFTKGMNWEKFRAGEIHIDHIIPLSSFDLSNPDELRAAWCITNLRPLWAHENLKKSNKRVLLI